MRDDELDTCGCCEGIAPRTPRYNRPGKPAIDYRLDTHGMFLRRMMVRLSMQSIPDGKNAGSRPLTALTTRATDDPAIAILDAWAVIADVLTFYQERIANECFLHTATERRSVLELARAIGYELKPGVAASTYLAFTIEDVPGAPGHAIIDKGIRVMSIPGQDEKPQTFETIERIEALAEWNALKPRITEPKIPGLGAKDVYLKGVTTGLKIGDWLLFVGEEREQDPGSERWDFRQVKTVTADPDAGHTEVTWGEGLGWERSGRRIPPAQKNLQVYAFREHASLFGYNAPDWRAMPESVKRAYLDPPPIGTGRGLHAEYFDNIDLTNLKVTRVDPQVNFDWGSGSPDPSIIEPYTFSARWTGFVQPKSSGDYTFYTISDDGVRLWVDGKLIIDNWTAPLLAENKVRIQLEAGQIYEIKLEYYKQRDGATIKLSWSGPSQPEEIIPASQLYPPDYYLEANQWPNFNVTPPGIYLSAVYPHILPGSWLVLSIPEYQELYQIENVSEDARSDFTLTAKTTRVTLKGENLSRFNSKLRETSVFAQSELLEMAEVPITRVLADDRIELDRLVQGLYKGKTLIVNGKRMRALVTEKSTGLKLVSSDGTERTLSPGDVLQVLEPPDESRAEVLWKLMDRNGFAGSVTAPADGILLQPAAKEDDIISEVVVLSEVSDSNGRTTLIFMEAMKNSYDPATVTVYANVARATHGETVHEVLGSGSAAEAHQLFALKKPPLTYVSAPTPRGTLSTLTVRVNGMQWQEAPSLYGLDRRSQNYIVRIDDDGKTSIAFGDGRNSARLPTGVENATAVYRSGIGHDGEVGAESLTLLQTKPLGVRSVTNPLSASGAESPENLSDARRNAPVTVLTLDRIVSLRDFENLARSFAGIGKAQASALKVGLSRIVHITVAAANGSKVEGEPLENLCNAIDAVRDPIEHVEVDSFQLRTFSIEAGILVDPRYLAEEVLAEVEAFLRNTFSFENRDFGQPVTAAEVLSLIQAVEGVVAVDLNKLKLDPPSDTPVPSMRSNSMAGTSSTPGMSRSGNIVMGERVMLDPRFLQFHRLIKHVSWMSGLVSPSAILTSEKAQVKDGKILPAELLLLNPAAEGVDLEELKR